MTKYTYSPVTDEKSKPAKEEYIKKRGEYAPERNYYADLDVQEVDATSSVLLSAARHLSEYCDLTNATFMKCKVDNGMDPAKCLEENKAVTACGLEFFKVLRATCQKEFTDHFTCMDYEAQNFKRCAAEEKVFDQCVFTKLGLGGTAPVKGGKSAIAKENEKKSK